MLIKCKAVFKDLLHAMEAATPHEQCHRKAGKRVLHEQSNTDAGRLAGEAPGRAAKGARRLLGQAGGQVDGETAHSQLLRVGHHRVCHLLGHIECSALRMHSNVI